MNTRLPACDIASYIATDLLLMDLSVASRIFSVMSHAAK